MNALEWNRDFSRPIEEIRAPRARHDRSAGPRPRHGLLCRDAARACRPVRGDADRAVRPPRQPAARLALAGAGVGDDAGAARVVPRDGSGAASWCRCATPPVSIGISSAGRATTVARAPVGYILSLEGADSIVSMRHLERAYEAGLRAIGPAHYGPGTYAQGTDADGGIGTRGRELLREMERLGVILDATHLCDDELLGSARRVPRAGVGEPLQLPRARAAQPAVLGRSDPRAGRARRGDRRRRSTPG